ncbi:hypothetical protein [Microbacterium sp. A93]|uniref:hypothetical protein n=1 Tax=Microbacterium sp. A93 TaxID=3450716 RepID=UPI003F431FC0
MTDDLTPEQQPTEADQQRTAREASRLSYRGQVPDDWHDEYDRLARRMQPQAAALIIRDRIRRRKVEAALPVADSVVADLRR